MVCAALMQSCTQDNVHTPADGGGQEIWEVYTATYQGCLVTTVPLMQEHLQGPVQTNMCVQLSNFHSAHSGYVNVRIQPFSINDPFVTELLGKTVEIGEMDIRDVEYAAFPSGGGYLRKDVFEVQAGEYTVRGSFSGQLSVDGHLAFSLCYRPGTMPFDVVSEFETNQ